MAKIDNTDKPDRWTLLKWLDGVSTFFRGGGKMLVSSGITSGGVPPPEAIAAMAKQRQREGSLAGQQGTAFMSRMEEAQKKNMVWDNDLQPLVWDRLRSSFHPENFRRMKLTPSLWTNQLRRVVNDLSILYENPAHRKLTDPKAKPAKPPAPAPPPEPVIPSKFKKAKEVDPEEEVEPTGPTEAPAGEPPEGEGAPEQEGAAPTQDPSLQPGTGDPDIDALAAVLQLTNTETKEDDGPLEKLLKLVDLDVVLERVEKLTRFHEAVWVRPMVTYEDRLEPMEGDPDAAERGDPKTGKLTFVVYTPGEADVLEDPNNPGEALAWWYFGKQLLPSGKMEEVIHFFTAETYTLMDSEWKVLKSETNELGRLPVTVFRCALPSTNSYFVKGQGRDLFEATLEFCYLRTVQNGRYRDSGFKQLALQGVDPEDVPDDQVMGGPTPVYIPDGGSATVLDMSPDLKPMSEMISKRALEQAAGYGITGANYKQESAPASGFAKKLDQQGILKENKRIRKFFAEAEKDLFKNIVKTLELSPIDGLDAFPEGHEYSVDFGEPTFEEDPAAQATADAQGIKLNKLSILDVLRRDDPDSTDVELLRKAYRNKRINEAFLPASAMKLIDIMAGAAQQELSFERVAGAGKTTPMGGVAPPPAPEEDAG